MKLALDVELALNVDLALGVELVYLALDVEMALDILPLKLPGAGWFEIVIFVELQIE